MGNALKAPYIRKQGSFGSLVAWIVDGSLVRRKLDNEFTNFGQHYRFPFIPEHELWLDQEAVPNERKFFVDHLLVEWRLMRNGMPYGHALELADKKELTERRKAKEYKLRADKPLTALHEDIRVRQIGSAQQDIEIYLTRGNLIRDFFRIEFTEGGHDLVYSFVPTSQVWIDNDLVVEEHGYIILHELLERSLMARGHAYHAAHRQASKKEWAVRCKPSLLPKSLTALGFQEAR